MQEWAVAVAMAVAMVGGARASNLDVQGSWYTDDGMSIVEIQDCGDGTPCGSVTWLDPSIDGDVCDENNPDLSLRHRRMMGLRLLEGFERGRGRWKSGAIYNPKNGQTYRARLELLSNNQLGVSGCLGPICKKFIWERAEPVGGDHLTDRKMRGSEDIASL
ncbi:MAG: DUF2147 domain-containing protein [Pseudomonadota bacterium]